MKYILVGHGEYARYCKKSCEMITGDVKDFYDLSFTEDMSKEQLQALYEKVIEENALSEVTIITDILGGTPYNAAVSLIALREKVNLVSGLSLQMLISLSAGEELTAAMEAAKQAVVLYGREDKIGPKADEPMKKDSKLNNQSANTAKGNGITHVRIDERLIHGQVATMWVNHLNVNRIMIIDDDVVKNEIDKMALKAVVPSNMKLSILSVKGAIEKIKSGRYVGQRVFVIAKKPAVIKELVDNEISIKQVNVGNLSSKDGRKQIKKSVYVSDAEIKDLKDIAAKGIEVTAQMVPSDERKSIEAYVL